MATMKSARLVQSAPVATVEPAIPAGRRLIIGLAMLAMAGIAGLAAISALRDGGAGLLPVGMGRLTDFALESGVPGAGLLAFLERGHLSVALLAGGLLLLVGRSAEPQLGAGECLVFKRRASFRRQLPVLFVGIGLIMAGQWLAVAVHPIAAGIVELPASSAIGWVLWHIMIPESRPALAIICDDNDGFANRLEITDGVHNRSGSFTIRHDQLAQARLLQPTWTRLFHFRDLLLETRWGDPLVLRIDAIAPPDELREIVAYLNGGFHYALTENARDWRSRFSDTR